MHLQQWLKVHTPFSTTTIISIIIYNNVSAAPSNDELLTDVITILEELLPAQNKTYELGLKLKLPEYVVEGIHKSFSDPQTRLLHVLMEFRNQMEPRPTWRVIVDALRSPAVNLPQLASEVEAAHFPKSVQTKVSNNFGRNPSSLPPSLSLYPPPPPLPLSLSLTHAHTHTCTFIPYQFSLLYVYLI